MEEGNLNSALDQMLDITPEEQFPASLIEVRGKDIPPAEELVPTDPPAVGLIPPSSVDSDLQKALKSIGEDHLRMALLYSDDSRARKMSVEMAHPDWLKKGWTPALLARYNRLSLREIYGIVNQFYDARGKAVLAKESEKVAGRMAREASGVRQVCEACHGDGGNGGCPMCNGRGFVIRADAGARKDFLESVGWVGKSQININSNNQTLTMESIVGDIEEMEKRGPVVDVKTEE